MTALSRREVGRKVPVTAGTHMQRSSDTKTSNRLLDALPPESFEPLQSQKRTLCARPRRACAAGWACLPPRRGVDR